MIENKILIGKSRKEVIEMLGEVQDQEFNKSKIISYQLEEIYRAIDPIACEKLTITFDEENKVERAKIEFYKTYDWSYF